MREIDMVADLLDKPGPSMAAVEKGRRRLRQEGASRRSRRGLVFGGLSGLTTLVAGGAAATVLLAGGGEQIPAEPDSAALVLRSAAERAETTSWASGKFWYVKASFRLAQSQDGPADIDQLSASWRNRAGQGWFKSINPSRKVFKARGSRFSLCDKEVSYQRIQQLPTQPDALRAEVRKAMQNNDDGPVPAEEQDQFLTSCMISLLSGQPAPPKVRAAAFRALADLPETQELGTRQDSTGREGTALAITNGDIRDELVIDPATSTVLETQRIQDGNGFKSVQTRTVYEINWTDAPPS